MNDDAPQGLVPPRPNLGPEPWHDPQPLSRAVLVIVVLVLLLLASLIWRRYRRSPARASRGSLPSGDITSFNPNPRDQLVALSASIRDALTVPFGTACRAMTTEELSTDGRLEQLLGDQDLRELIRFLDQVDHLKFAPERSNHQLDGLQETLTSWEPRIETLRVRIRAKPKDRAKRGNHQRRLARPGANA